MRPPLTAVVTGPLRTQLPPLAPGEPLSWPLCHAMPLRTVMGVQKRPRLLDPQQRARSRPLRPGPPVPGGFGRGRDVSRRGAPGARTKEAMPAPRPRKCRPASPLEPWVVVVVVVVGLTILDMC